jgi:hypothetical protein
MYPDELFEWQLSAYQPGDEDGSEYDRNGAFHWWLKRALTSTQLENLLRLAALDPDPFLGNDLHSYVRKAKSYDDRLARLELNLFPET